MYAQRVYSQRKAAAAAVAVVRIAQDVWLVDIH